LFSKVSFVPESCPAGETQLVFTSSSNDGESAQIYVFDFAPGEETK
jgi:Tol biopolymer transport system component